MWDVGNVGVKRKWTVDDDDDEVKMYLQENFCFSMLKFDKVSGKRRRMF